jgi:AhpD family alkylhydroperoxidase
MRRSIKSLNTLQPDAAKGFQALTKAAKSPGTLDVKTLEFVALGIAVADRCEPCIAFHVEALIKAGATRNEIGEVLSMCVQMGGGPSLMYAAKALDCFDALSGATET